MEESATEYSKDVRRDARKETEFMVRLAVNVARHRERSLPFGPLKGPRFGYHQDTPPNVLACDHDWRQVSWLAGHCLSSPSRV